jgi:Inner membrane protein YgaP-like, transmembrane domain
LIRSGAGMAFLAFGWFYGHSILLMGIGGVLLFSAFYDRCPIYKAIVPRLKTLFQRSG